MKKQQKCRCCDLVDLKCVLVIRLVVLIDRIRSITRVGVPRVAGLQASTRKLYVFMICTTWTPLDSDKIKLLP